jgi:iron(III) transport system permease protein
VSAIARASGGFHAAAWLTAGVVASPLLAVAFNLLTPRWEVWRHVADTMLLELAFNTFLLLAGVGLLAGALGVGLAWLVSAHRFPGRAFFEWALVLPMAVPAYVLAFVFAALFGYTGPVATSLREAFGPDAFFPDVRTFPGVVLVMSLVLYPYVYLLARAGFGSLGAAPLEAARSLGSKHPFWRVAFPLSRPAIAAGLALALMEALADFGAVSVLGFRTFTTAIYRVWFGMFDRVAAGQLSCVLLLFALAVLSLERRARGRARFIQRHGRTLRDALPPLSRARAYAASAFCAVTLFSAFLLPLSLLGFWTVRAVLEEKLPSNFAALLKNTAMLGLGAAFLTLLAATAIAYGQRISRSPSLVWASRIASLGYAIPGSVIAVGVLLVLSGADRALGSMVLTGSAMGLLLAYVVRFVSVAFFTVEAGLESIPPSLDEAARSLGASPGGVLTRVHAPLLKGSVLTAAILVLVDVMKEMPATMLIRPFGMDTLAVDVWQRTSESMWREASLPALTIVLAGLLPAILLVRHSSPEKR